MASSTAASHRITYRLDIHSWPAIVVLIAYALKQSWVQNKTLFLLILCLFVASNFITSTMGGLSLLPVVMFYLVVIHVTGTSAKLEQS